MHAQTTYTDQVADKMRYLQSDSLRQKWSHYQCHDQQLVTMWAYAQWT